MKQSSYELIVRCVTFGAPALAKEVVDDLNATLEDYDKLRKPAKEITEKKEN